jgi:hypothetical protein
MDCASFVAQAYKDATGVTIPLSSGAMWREGTKVSRPEPGDIIVMNSSGGWSPNHVALYAGPGTWLQALSEGPKRGVVETEPDYIKNQKVLGYVTFVGAGMGDKAGFNPPSVTDIDFTLTGAPDIDREPVPMEAGAMLRFNFKNQTGKTLALRYRFVREPGGAESANDGEGFSLRGDAVFRSLLRLPEESGVYRLEVYSGQTLILARAWRVF